MTMTSQEAFEAMQQELLLVRAENDRLKKVSAAKLRFKVGEKGGVMVMGLQQFPVTLYKGQWDRLIEAIPALQAFIAQNIDKLAVKA